MGPAGHPDMLIDLLLRIQDTDQNGVLSAYELLWVLINYFFLLNLPK